MSNDPAPLTWEQLVKDNNAPPPPMPPLDTGVYPYGINGFSWELGGDEWMGDPKRVPGPQYAAMTGWFIIYQQAQSLHGPAKPTTPCKVSLRKQQGYVHLKSGGWKKLQDDVQKLICAQLDPHQTHNTGSPPVTKESDGSWSWPSPPQDSINHGWPEARGGFAAGSVDGMYWDFEMKVDKDGANLIAANGTDWWTAASGPSTNTGYSQSNWVPLDTNWKRITGTSMSREALLRDPPPPLQGMGSQPPDVINPSPPSSGSNVEIWVDGVQKTSGEVTFKIGGASTAQHSAQTRGARHMVDEQKEAAKAAREETEKQEKEQQEKFEAQNKPPPQSVDTETPPGDRANLPHAAENTSPPHKPSPSDPASGGMRGTDDMPGKESGPAKPAPAQHATHPSGMKKEEDKPEPGSHKK